MEEKTIRIQKYLSDAGVASRRKIEDMIINKDIKINGKIAKLGCKIDPELDVVEIKDKKLKKLENNKVYIAMYKPKGYVTTMNDNFGRKCIKDLVKNIKTRVYPIGRLDKDSEGLLLLTNDGAFANFVMHPCNNIEKKYLVTVKPTITEETLKRLCAGVKVKGEYLAAKQIKVLSPKSESDGTSLLKITLTEGKNRHIRKMCKAVNLLVLKLKRISIGNIKLFYLKTGEYRNLTESELKKLYY